MGLCIFRAQGRALSVVVLALRPGAVLRSRHQPAAPEDIKSHSSP